MDRDVYMHYVSKQKTVAPGIRRQWTQILDGYMIKRVQDLIKESPDAFDTETKFNLAYQFMSRNIPGNIATERFTKFCTAVMISGEAEKLTKTFEKLKKEENLDEMFRYFHNMKEISFFTSNETKKDLKSEELAVQRRKEGNVFYQKKDFEKALKKYNLSIMAAPHPNKDNSDEKENQCSALSMSYANRSALLLELKEYNKCLTDIDRALNLGYPEDLKTKLLIRKAKSLMALKRNQEASALLDDCIKFMEDITITDSKTKATTDHLHELKETSLQSEEVGIANIESKEYKIFNMRDTSTADLIFAYQCPSPPNITCGTHHKAIPSFSNCLSLKHSDEKGRYVVANRNIYPGEVVALEKAFATCIDPLESESLEKYCTYCTSRCAAPVPCTHCTRVIFCNEECRSKCWKEFHAVECSLLLTINNVGFVQPFCLVLALRMLINTSFTDLKKLLPKCKEESKKPRLVQGFNERFKYDPTDYRTVYHFELNIEERSTEHLMHMCGWAFLVTNLLIKSKTYFTNNSGKSFDPTEEDIQLVGSALFRNLLATRCNDKSLVEIQIDVSKKYDGRDEPYDYLPSFIYGNGIFPTLALFNSDCNPSLEGSNYGNYFAYHAIRFIPSGTEVSVRYLPPYHEEGSKEARKTNLYNKFLFDCKCEACEKNWVVKGNPSANYVPKLRDPESRISEHLQSHRILQTQLKEILKQDECVRMSRRSHANDDHDPTDLKLIKETIEFYDRYVELPQTIYCLSQTLLSDIYQKRAHVNYFRTGPYSPPDFNYKFPPGWIPPKAEDCKTHMFG